MSPVSPRRRLLTGVLALAGLAAVIGVAALVVVPGMQGGPAAESALVEPSPTPSPSSAPTAAPTVALQPCENGSAPTAAPTAAQTPAGSVPAGYRTAAHVVNIGFEDLTSSDPNRIAFLAAKLDEMHATGVSLTVGRLDWLAFPWIGHADTESSDVENTGRDYVAEAIAAFRCDANGYQRDISLGIDTLFGRQLTGHPELQGVDESGNASALFGSLTAWKNGPLAGQLADAAHELAVRYRPNAVNVTELFFDTNTFGADDLADFKATEHADAWPRAADGTVDRSDPRVQDWRTGAMVSILGRVKTGLASTGVALTTDVRSPVTLDPAGRPDMGQDYPRLLQVVDRINVWDFPGIAVSGVLDADQLGPLLFADQPDRFTLEIGLWEGSGTISTERLKAELASADRQGIRSVSVTPASLFSDAVFDSLTSAWAPR